MPVDPAGRAERATWLRLTLAPGVGPVTAHRLLQTFGLPEDVLSAGHAALAACAGPAVARALCTPDADRDAQVARCLDWAQAAGHHLVAWGDADYPQGLLALADPPPLLFVQGRLEALNRPAIAVVGARQATRAGADHAEGFARALADAGLVVISGLAAGIDAAAHRGACAGHAGTIAVVGTGPDLVYPARHRPLAEAIVAAGAIVSEFPVGEPPVRANFPRRNRLIAALGCGVLVVEAARQSGSLITARLAAELGREVFAIPGSIDSPMTRGCHALIRQGAALVESVQDVLDALPRTVREALSGAAGATGGRAVHAGPAPAPAGTVLAENEPARDAPGETADDRPGRPLHPAAWARDPRERALLQALGWDPASIDDLASRSDSSISEVNTYLSMMELDGRIERLADGRFSRRRVDG
jgi:DNA processing protein